MICKCGNEIPDHLIQGPVRCSCGHWTHTVIPFWVKRVTAWRSPEDIGVGDTFHRLATRIGADRVSQLIAWFGIDCGCEGRRDAWNDLYKYDDAN